MIADNNCKHGLLPLSLAVDMAQKKTGNTDDDDIVNDEQQCEGAEDNDKCLRREKGQVPPSIDTGGIISPHQYTVSS